MSHAQAACFLCGRGTAVATYEAITMSAPRSDAPFMDGTGCTKTGIIPTAIPPKNNGAATSSNLPFRVSFMIFPFNGITVMNTV